MSSRMTGRLGGSAKTLSAASLILLLAACSGAAPTSTPGSSPTAGTPAASPTAAATGAGYQDGDRVTLVVPYSAGGGFDVYARTAQPCIESALREVTGSDVSVIVENVGGAGGQVGTEQVFRSPSDGTQWIFNTVDQMAGQEVLQDAEFETLEFTPIGQLAYYTYALVARSNLMEGDWGLTELLERSQETPILMGGVGLDVQARLLVHLLTEAGHPMEIDFISFEGTGDAVAAMLRNELELYMVSMPTALQLVEANPDELRILVNVGPDYAVAEGIPTLADEGINNAEQIASGVGVGNRAFFGPPDMDPAAAAAAQEALRIATQPDSECVTASNEAGYPVTYASPEELAESVAPIVETYEANADVLRQE